MLVVNSELNIEDVIINKLLIQNKKKEQNYRK